MQRRATKNTRAANAREKRFHNFTAERDCITCGNDGPSIVHHCEGSAFKHNKVLIGHFFVIPLCYNCDTIITYEGKKVFREKFGPQSQLWLKHALNEDLPLISHPPKEIEESILDWNL